VAVAANLDHAGGLLALLADDDTEAAHLAACGLVGEGPAIEYLTWRREADLPDPALVIANPATPTCSPSTAVQVQCAPPTAPPAG